VRPLTAVKLLHTVAWAVFAGAIVAIPISAWFRQFDWVVGLSLLVAGEVVVLALSGWSCPLTAVAARYTTDRQPNFDIYLPEWLARYNKQIFGPLYIGGMLFAWARWKGWVG
jgi:hypothetical protein